MIFIGIDPGLGGGIATIAGGKLNVARTPTIGGKEYDIQAMTQLLKGHVQFECFAVIENQISMPGQGLTSTLQTGKGFGIWLGLLAGLGIPYQVIGARQWQVKLFTGVKGNLDTKAKSEVIAKRLFPSVDFRKSERSHVANDGLTDAACIAEYGRRIHEGTAGKVSGIPHYAGMVTPLICCKCGTYIPTATENDCHESIPKDN